MLSGGIGSFYISGDTTKVTLYQSSLLLSITHIAGFGKTLQDIASTKDITSIYYPLDGTLK